MKTNKMKQIEQKTFNKTQKNKNEIIMKILTK